LRDQVGGLDENTVKTINDARILGLLRSKEIASKRPSQPKPVPVREDHWGDRVRFKTELLDWLLIARPMQDEPVTESIASDENRDDRSLIG
jgi:hypothetical protein